MTTATILSSTEVREFFDSYETSKKRALAAEALWFFDPTANSDKVYFLRIVQTDGGCALIAKWGRRGGTLSEQLKATGSFETCKAEMAELLNEKIRKGYQRVRKAELADLPEETGKNFPMAA